MFGMMIIAHAPLASALKSVALHAFPECAGALEALDVLAHMSAEEVESQARVMLERVRTPEALIFTDVFGATPCNVAQRLSDGVQVRLVAGVNVPMLWRSLCYRNESIDAVVVRALAGGSQGVMSVSRPSPQNQTIQVPDHDQDPHHHQQ